MTYPGGKSTEKADGIRFGGIKKKKRRGELVRGAFPGGKKSLEHGRWVAQEMLKLCSMGRYVLREGERKELRGKRRRGRELSLLREKKKSGEGGARDARIFAEKRGGGV